jgi:hypothetical protein
MIKECRCTAKKCVKLRRKSAGFTHQLLNVLLPFYSEKQRSKMKEVREAALEERKQKAAREKEEKEREKEAKKAAAEAMKRCVCVSICMIVWVCVRMLVFVVC